MQDSFWGMWKKHIEALPPAINISHLVWQETALPAHWHTSLKPRLERSVWQETALLAHWHTSLKPRLERSVWQGAIWILLYGYAIVRTGICFHLFSMFLLIDCLKNGNALNKIIF